MAKESDYYYVGIDAGSVSLNCIVINQEGQIIYESPYLRHLGKVEDDTSALIRDLYEKFGQETIRSISFTGNHGKKFSETLGAFYEFETISQVLGAIYIRPDVKTIICMGGQETALFQINHYDGIDPSDQDKRLPGQNNWELDYFNTNGPCASGTGPLERPSRPTGLLGRRAARR